MTELYTNYHGRQSTGAPTKCGCQVWVRGAIRHEFGPHAWGAMTSKGGGAMYGVNHQGFSAKEPISPCKETGATISPMKLTSPYFLVSDIGRFSLTFVRLSSAQSIRILFTPMKSVSKSKSMVCASSSRWSTQSSSWSLECRVVLRAVKLAGTIIISTNSGVPF